MNTIEILTPAGGRITLTLEAGRLYMAWGGDAHSMAFTARPCRARLAKYYLRGAAQGRFGGTWGKERTFARAARLAI